MTFMLWGLIKVIIFERYDTPIIQIKIPAFLFFKNRNSPSWTLFPNFKKNLKYRFIFIYVSTVIDIFYDPKKLVGGDLF